MSSKEQPRNSGEEIPGLDPDDFRFYAKDSIKFGPNTADRVFLNERGIDDYEKQLGISCKDLAGKDVLNLGSGSQLWFENQLKEAGIDARVISMSPDYSIEKHRIIAREKQPGNTAIIAGLGQELAFKDGSFDTVLVLHVTDHLKTEEAYEALLREVIRVLRVGGEARIFPVSGEYFPGIVSGVASTERGTKIELQPGIGFAYSKSKFHYDRHGEVRYERIPMQIVIIKKTA